MPLVQVERGSRLFVFDSLPEEVWQGLFQVLLLQTEYVAETTSCFAEPGLGFRLWVWYLMLGAKFTGHSVGVQGGRCASPILSGD